VRQSKNQSKKAATPTKSRFERVSPAARGLWRDANELGTSSHAELRSLEKRGARDEPLRRSTKQRQRQVR
jgi:hypothetical protein